MTIKINRYRIDEIQHVRYRLSGDTMTRETDVNRHISIPRQANNAQRAGLESLQRLLDAIRELQENGTVEIEFDFTEGA